MVLPPSLFYFPGATHPHMTEWPLCLECHLHVNSQAFVTWSLNDHCFFPSLRAVFPHPVPRLLILSLSLLLIKLLLLLMNCLPDPQSKFCLSHMDRQCFMHGAHVGTEHMWARSTCVLNLASHAHLRPAGHRNELKYL